MAIWIIYWHRIIKDGIDTSILGPIWHYSSHIVAMLKLATEWTSASEYMVLRTACAIKINVNATILDMAHSSRWNQARQRSDKRTTTTAITWSYVDLLQNHINCQQSFRLQILNYLQGIYYGMLASLDGAFVILCLLVYMDSFHQSFIY